MKILIVGATGVLGRRVIERLRERYVIIRALVRDPARAQDLAEAGIEIVAGDLIDPPSLLRACTGVDRVLAAAHGWSGRGRHRSENVDGTGHRALIAAAKAADVQRFVYVSAHAARPDHPLDFFRTKHAIEQVLNLSGLDAVIVRPTAFMEHHAHARNGSRVLASGTVKLVGSGRKPRNFVSAADVAWFVERALLEDPPPFRLLSIGGPGNYSDLEVAALYAKTARIKLHVTRTPAAVAGLLSNLARPVHPGWARTLRFSSLSDEASPERFESAPALEQKYRVRLTLLEAFVKARVREARQR